MPVLDGYRFEEDFEVVNQIVNREHDGLIDLAQHNRAASCGALLAADSACWQPGLF